MCTSLSYEALDGSKFLARTMDFSFVLNGNPTFLPRNYKWINSLDGKTETAKYAIIGTGAKYGNNYMVADGFNEYGLATAELYFANEAVYDQAPVDGAVNVVGEEFILWLLGNNKSIDEVRENIKNVHIVESDKGVMGKNQPLHWILTDATGKTFVIEPRGNGLVLEEDPVNVMTNTPDLDWHITNLSNYLGIQKETFNSKMYGTKEVIPLGFNGLARQPGGYSAVDRFIRTVFNRQNMSQAKDSTEAVNTILHMLDGVTIPYGINTRDGGDPDFTQYQMVMDVTNKAAYFVPYANRTVFKVTMTDELLEKQTEPKEFVVGATQEFSALN
ncbi:choloylglycine hydrolase family protein [Companilactobacillus mishanensis]|uniref:Choloylglycine hydrolase family protein n=1 Tax=Companilactobacillus mishanensis TaxID=2486008 RepID=A0A5P0ZJI2_9LACO|nr:choloylglycine hydrolase family protein [Companilactobacillus mishanensis]MQS45304.1 choloylglycine hydrolase family protein [Companilactobacillus mishanensis]MQS53276.1 choloylglycine hydrolase family protein [Companilactobacillus mishanensis]MQS90040.1 choloylglycine hydrolase family protein [Companilactobacillus mishanensis]